MEHTTERMSASSKPGTVTDESSKKLSINGSPDSIDESSEKTQTISFDSIRSDLDAVESILRRELTSEVDSVAEMLSHPMFWNGKRLRPALLLLAGKSTGNIKSNHHLLAAVLEMIHCATLVHDDVLDDAETRRHCRSINRGWGKHLSVLLGDFLFSHAFYLSSTLESTYACQRIGVATNTVCAGEIQQIDSTGRLDLTESEYFQIIDGKTASLCACASQLGAYCSGVDEKTINLFENVGLNYGRAFQITDDILDLRGSEETVGKSLGTDALQKKMTLPLIETFKQLDPTQKRFWDEQLDSGQFEIQQLVDLVSTHGGFDYAMKVAESFVRDAQTSLQQSEYAERSSDLIAIGNYIIDRYH